MADIAASSSDSQPKDDKPVVVRVKRKANQSPLEALWLEINERPQKRPLLDFGNLSISDSSTKVEEPRAKKVLVHHVETVINSDLTVDFLQSFMPYSSEASQPKVKNLEERQNIKADKKQDKLLAKARHDQEVLSTSARFEQIWRSRKGNRGETKTEDVHEVCHLYDIVRIDVEENVNGKEEEVEEEDHDFEHKIMASYLPLLREFVPDGAVEVESDIRDYMSKKASKNDDYVYDYYAVKEDDINKIQDGESCPFPLVQVNEDDEFYDGPDDPDNESYDSNAEDNPDYDYPDEEDSEDDDEDAGSKSSKDDDDEEESEVSNDKSVEGDKYGLSESEDTEQRYVAPHIKDADIVYDDEFCDDDDDDDDDYNEYYR
ncbi:RNA-directed DNA methylation 4 isoform X2 [Impatiens glandulifera]|uniref:RNA-directed DNA methylation 4 isoform X2 n=1 Tax=Impatiens glandulifera TaxID=253017 RepID=UPI001FB15370|nr:RNA-directed DNA methylation 4 isoform X2 [Impatiens glandulifera]